MIEREANAGRPVTVLIFDLDHFKSINDRFGHPAGDEILKLFAAVVINTLRISATSRGASAARNSPRCCPVRSRKACSPPSACAKCLRLRGSSVEEGPVETTVSIGVAGGPAGTEFEVLLAAADAALYQAKRGGRNRVKAAEELPLSLENWRRKTAGFTRYPQPGVARLA